jgi:hypothetical protein
MSNFKKIIALIGVAYILACIAGTIFFEGQIFFEGLGL